MLQNEIKPNINVIIGRNLKIARTSNDKTLEWVGRQVGVSFQQIQKYERGDSQISAQRLFSLANILDWPVAAFFKEGEIEGYKELTKTDLRKYDDLIALLISAKKQKDMKISDFFTILRRIEILIS